MRYAQGGGLTAERRQFRERIRYEAGERFTRGEKNVVIAKDLRVSERSVERWRRAWREGGMEALATAGHTVADAVNDAIRASITRLIQTHEVDLDAYTGPVYFMMHGLESEERARELAAALHAALYGDLEPLAGAVPPAP